MAALRGDIRFRYLKQFFLVIYCSFKKRGVKLGGVMVFNAMAILFYRWSIPRKPLTCRKSDKLYP